MNKQQKKARAHVRNVERHDAKILLEESRTRRESATIESVLIRHLPHIASYNHEKAWFSTERNASLEVMVCITIAGTREESHLTLVVQLNTAQIERKIAIAHQYFARRVVGLTLTQAHAMCGLPIKYLDILRAM